MNDKIYEDEQNSSLDNSKNNEQLDIQDNKENIENNNFENADIRTSSEEKVQNKEENVFDKSFFGFVCLIFFNDFKYKSFIFFICIIEFIIYCVCLIKGIESDTEKLFAPKTETLKYGMKMNLEIRNGHVWRWFTYGFLHDNFAHLFFNLFSQIIIGSTINSNLGSLKTCIIFFGTVIGGGMFSSVIKRSDDTVGASVFLCGLFSAYLGYCVANYYRLKSDDRFKELISQIVLYFLVTAFNFKYDFLFQRIDNIGNIGGLLFGFFWGIIVSKPDEVQISLFLQYKVLLIISIAVVSIAYIVLIICFFIIAK